MGYERREYFRVNTNAFVALAKIDQQHNSIPEYFPDLSQFILHQQLEEINHQCFEHLNNLKDQTAHKLLQLQNQKIDILVKLLQQKAVQDSQIQVQKIEISEGGVSVINQHRFVLNQQLAIMLIFTPSYEIVYCQGTVVELSQAEQQLHIQFEQIATSQRQKLVQLLLKEQTHQRQLQQQQ